MTYECFKLDIADHIAGPALNTTHARTIGRNEPCRSTMSA